MAPAAVSKTVRRMQAKLKTLDTAIAKKSQQGTPDPRTPSREQVFGAPSVRKGESVLTSRGFQFQRMIGAMCNVLPAEMAKVETEAIQMMKKTYIDKGYYKTAGADQYVPSMSANAACIMPLGAEMLIGGDGCEVNDEFRYTMKSMMVAGTQNFDPEEMQTIMRKVYSKQEYTGYEKKAVQSWIDETLGGALVAPAAFGELIQLLRNKDALINAGARVEALPPQGRLKLPRQTTPTTGYFVGENTQITPSTFGTGFLELSAKKCAAIVTLPNELIRYASPASEAILRADLTKTLSLTADYYLLYGESNNINPLGLVNTPNTVTITPSDDSNAELAPQDLYAFISAIEANNGDFQGWIMRPELFYDFVSARAGVYNGSAVVQNGQYIFDQFRQLGQGFGKVVAGYPATTTSQVAINRPLIGNLSSLTGTTLFGGQWDDYIFAMFGGIEFAQANQYGGGNALFDNDQTAVRAVLNMDGGPRHQGVFAIADGIVLGCGP